MISLICNSGRVVVLLALGGALGFTSCSSDDGSGGAGGASGYYTPDGAHGGGSGVIARDSGVVDDVSNDTSMVALDASGGGGANNGGGGNGGSGGNGGVNWGGGSGGGATTGGSDAGDASTHHDAGGDVSVGDSSSDAASDAVATDVSADVTSPDAGADATDGQPQDVHADTPSDAADPCRTCERVTQGAKCLAKLEACETATGTIATGPLAGQTQSDVCKQIVSCIRATRCLSATTPGAFTNCFCGNGVDVATCAAETTLQGACAELIQGATEVTGAAAVAAASTDVANPSGLAYAIIGCDARFCSASCLY